MAKKWRLYLVQPESIGEKERYFLITRGWSLLYTCRKAPEGSREITNLKKLPAVAVEWLSSTIDQVREEYLRENANEILRRGKQFNERFEEELEIERKKFEAAKETQTDTE